MKILVISHMYPSTFNEVAGIFVHEQVKALVRQGCEIKVLSPVPCTPFPVNRLHAKWKAYSEIPKQENRDGIEVYYPRYLAFPTGCFFGYSGYSMYWGVKKVVDCVYDDFRFDLIHAHVALPDGFAAMMVNKRYHKPIAVTIHGMDIYVTVNKSQKCRERIYQVLQSANKIIVVSSILSQMVKEYFTDLDSKIQIIPNGIPPERISKDTTVRRNKYKDKRIILSVGFLIERKGHAYVLEALSSTIKRHPDTIYLIAGNGPEEGRLRNQAKSLDIDKHVEFLGRVDHQIAMELMSICDVFVLPSWNEAFGVVYIEAMAYGKPVIACVGEGIEDVVKHRKTGLLVKPKDVESLVEATDYLLRHPAEANAMGERARKLVFENYTWEKNAEKTNKVYKEILCES